MNGVESRAGAETSTAGGLAGFPLTMSKSLANLGLFPVCVGARDSIV